MEKKDLSERDICTKYITPALKQAGWDIHTQIREEVTLTAGRVIVKGQMGLRAKGKRADYVLYHKPNIPLAVVEAKDNKHCVGAGLQQAQGYADILDVPFIFSSNGDGFLFHDRTGLFPQVEQELSNEGFPSPGTLWDKYQQWKGYKPEETTVITQDYYEDGSGKSPRYYQMHAINKTIEAVARGQNRCLLVMATGTGKTYTAFQIIWRLWKAGVKKRILFLADRNILVDQTKTDIESNLVKPDTFKDMPHIAPNHIGKDTSRLLEYTTVGLDKVRSNKHYFYPGQILYSKIRPNLNKLVVVDFEGLCSADMYPIRTKIYTRYLCLFMLSNYFIEQAVADDNRVAMPKVNQERLNSIAVPVPPFEEQKRIVTKVDELMRLCDQLEQHLTTAYDQAEKLITATTRSLVA